MVLFTQTKTQIVISAQSNPRIMSKHRLLSFQVPLPFLQTLHEVTKPRLSKSHVWLTQHDYGGCCFPKCGSHLSKDKNMRWNQIHRELRVNLLLVIPWRMTTAVHDFPERVEIWLNSCPFTPYHLLQIFFKNCQKLVYPTYLANWNFECKLNALLLQSDIWRKIPSKPKFPPSFLR